jgi:hypothetical protein
MTLLFLCNHNACRSTRQTDDARKRKAFEQVIATLEYQLQGLAAFIRQQPNARAQQLQNELKRLEGLK